MLHLRPQGSSLITQSLSLAFYMRPQNCIVMQQLWSVANACEAHILHSALSRHCHLPPQLHNLTPLSALCTHFTHSHRASLIKAQQGEFGAHVVEEKPLDVGEVCDITMPFGWCSLWRVCCCMYLAGPDLAILLNGSAWLHALAFPSRS